MSELLNQQAVQPSTVVPVAVPQTEGEVFEDPKVVLPPGLRELQLSEDVAAILQQLFEDPRPPVCAGREMPSADASALLKSNRR